MTRGIAALLVVTAVASRPLVGQRVADLPGFELQQIATASDRTNPTNDIGSFQAPDHRYEGAIVGGLLVGLGGAVLVGGLCRSSDISDNCTWAAIKGGVLLGALGGLTGALIGGLFPKGEPEPRDSTPPAP